LATVLVKRRLAALGDRAGILFRVEFADGSHYQNGSGTPAFTIGCTSVRPSCTAPSHIRTYFFDGD
jgi:hypothetical protein